MGDAGPNHLGYYTATWDPRGTSILTHGFTGALHLWTRVPSGWEPRVGRAAAEKTLRAAPPARAAARIAAAAAAAAKTMCQVCQARQRPS
jgi:hypothetical protein